MATFKQTKDSAELADKESLNETPVFQVEDLESGKYLPQHGWLKKVWGKWPGEESIEELLAALKNDKR